MAAPSSILANLPTDIASAVTFLADLFGGPGEARAAMSGTSWPGGMALPDQAGRTAGSRPGGYHGMAGGLKASSGVATASAIMQAIQRSAERAQVETAIARFHLDPGDAAQLLSAHAYVWGRNFAPMLFWDVPYSGPINDRVAQAVGRFERDNPGTLGAATNGAAMPQQAIAAVIQAAVAAHAPIFHPPELEYRKSDAGPALSSSGRRARAAAGIQPGNRSWIAHHLLTFAGIAKLPRPTQQAMANCGWTMDGPANVIALPANFAAYLAQGPLPSRPYHAGRHPQYSARVDAALAKIAASTATGAELRLQLLAQDDVLRRYIASVARLGLLR